MQSPPSKITLPSKSKSRSKSYEKRIELSNQSKSTANRRHSHQPYAHPIRNIIPYPLKPINDAQSLQSLHTSQSPSADTINFLQTVGYERDDIMYALQFVINPNNLHEIMDKLCVQSCESIPSFSNLSLLSSIKAASSVHLIDMDHDNDNDNDNISHDSEMERKARNQMYIKNEIVNTEDTYCQCLDTLLNELIQPMFDYKYIDTKYYDTIISSLPRILQFHQHFLDKLNVKYVDNHYEGNIARVFNETIVENKEKFVDMYTFFMNDYIEICQLFVYEFKNNTAIDDFLATKEMNKHQLSSFFILPVQRLPRYILLLTDLIKNMRDDYHNYNTKYVLDIMKDMAVTINKNLKQIERISGHGHGHTHVVDNLNNKNIQNYEPNEYKFDIDVEQFTFHITIFFLTFILLLYLLFSYYFFSVVYQKL